MSNKFLNLKSRYKNGNLKNGMKYIYVKNSHINSVSINIYIRVGSKNEKNRKGFSSFFRTYVI